LGFLILACVVVVAKAKIGRDAETVWLFGIGAMRTSNLTKAIVSKSRIIERVKALDLPSVKLLLDGKPALLRVTDREGRNLLHVACSVPSAKGVPAAAAARIVNFLLDRGLEIDTPVGRESCTALFFAVARARNRTLVRLLLKRGAKVTSAPGGGLYAAGWWEDLGILRLLIDAGAPIDTADDMTPFLACWCWKKFEAAKFLAASGADVNHQDAKGKTALHYGVEKEFEPARLKWLVKHGASADVQDHNGVSPRSRASRKRDKRFTAALA
jgi:ankyrin repeat protein